MKKLLGLLLVLFIFTGCQSIKGGDLNDIKKRQKIVIGTEETWAPWTYTDEKDNVVGYDIEVGKYIADYIGVEAEFVKTEWDNILSGVKAGRFDLMINGCDVTDDRKQVYDFSDPYAFDKTVVIVRGDDDRIKTLEDLDGKDTANTPSSIYAEIAESYGAKNTPVDDLAETFELLKNKKIDATLNSEATFNYLMSVNPDYNFKVVCAYGDAADIAIPMKKGSSDLLAKVNEAIAAARADGTLLKLSMKYFGTDMTTK